jgi:phasin
MDVVADRKVKKIDSSTAFASFDMPKFEFPKMEIPEAFREALEKGTSQAKEFYEKAKIAADDANSLLESTYATTAKGTMNYNLKVIEMVRANTSAHFSFAHALLGVTGFSQLIELSTAHARAQFETLSEQSKALATLTQETMTQVTEPLKAEVSKAISKAA